MDTVKDILIGIDGGGSKTKIRVEDKDGYLIGQAVSGPSNIRLSVEKAWQSIREGLDEIFSASAISLHDTTYRFHMAAGLAGCEVSQACRVFLSYPHSFTTLLLQSDAHIACLGAHEGKDGAIIIVGTGVIGYEIEEGKTYRVGGWGFPHDDEGGGAWLGLEVAKQACQWLDGRIEKTPLVGEVFDYFNQDVDHFITWANHANSSDFAKLAPLVINHSQQEEAGAQRLMKKAAHAIDRLGMTLLKRRIHQEKKLSCCLLGGMAPFIEPWLSDELRETLSPRKGDANAGAILLIKQGMKEVC